MLETITRGIEVDEDRADAGGDRDGRGGEGPAVVVGRSQQHGEDDRDHREDLDGVGDRGAAGDRARPDHEADDQRDRRPAQGPRDGAGALAQLAGRAQLDERRAVQQTKPEQRHAGPQAVGGEQVEEVAGELVGGVDRQAVQQIAEADAEQQRDQEAAERHAPRPRLQPALVLVFACELERDAARHQRR